MLGEECIIFQTTASLLSLNVNTFSTDELGVLDR
jgi:hypothetical protein